MRTNSEARTGTSSVADDKGGSIFYRRGMIPPARPRLVCCGTVMLGRGTVARPGRGSTRTPRSMPDTYAHFETMTKLDDRTSESITRDEIERIAI